MGPYCIYCGLRCFVPLPPDTPEHIREAYGSATIVATCPRGQAFEREKVGWCYDMIKEAIKSENNYQHETR